MSTTEQLMQDITERLDALGDRVTEEQAKRIAHDVLAEAQADPE